VALEDFIGEIETCMRKCEVQEKEL
jgi:chromosome segregation ATPase